MPTLAYEVASQETFPSWGWWIVNGATTFYENWPIDAKSDISMKSYHVWRNQCMVL